MNVSMDHPSRPLLLTLLCAGLGTGLGAQEPSVFEEERRITAIDLVLAFESGAVREWATDSPTPKDLAPEDFEIFYDRRSLPVIAVEQAAEPWEILLFFDAELASSTGLRWAATALAERTGELTALGEVAVVVADPEPRTLLSSTRDSDSLHSILSMLASGQDGNDRLLALRGEAIEELPDIEPELALELVTELAREEARIVRRRHDELLLELTDRGGAGARRLLILAGNGYDLRPEAFYRPLATSEKADDATASAALAAATESLARTLSAYGWVTLPLVPPEPDPLKEGVRIGKLRLTAPSITVEEQQAGYETYDQTVINFFGAKVEGQRKPKRAEAYLELGSALHGQGKLEAAEDALRKAAYHFAGDPRTADRQAAAAIQLARVLEKQGKTQSATAALDLAHRLDPELTAADAGPLPALLEPLEPLGVLARETGGAVVRGSGGLADALAELGRRVRLTYQVAGLPDGELHALEARYRRGQRQLTYPGWARSSTPLSIAEARARRLLRGEPTGGELAVSAELLGNGEIRLSVALPAAEAGGENPETTLRLTLGYGDPDAEPSLEHRPLGSQTGRHQAWEYRIGVEAPEELTWLAVLVEDLNTGRWGARLIELP